MIRLDISYQGFKLGVRGADSLALLLDVHNPSDVFLLHKLKNLCYTLEGMRNLKTFGFNGQTYGFSS